MMAGCAALIPPDAIDPWPTLDLAYCDQHEPPPPDFIFPGFVVGTVGMLAAPGSTGKSMAGHQAAVHLAGGPDLLGFGKVKPGKVLVLAAEDPAEIIWARHRAIMRTATREERELVKENLTVKPLLGFTVDLLDDGQTEAAITKLAEGHRLVILDTLSRFHSGEENERRDAARVMRAGERIAQRTGAAELFPAHVGKAAALAGQGDQQQALKGSAVWVDEARWVAFLAGMSPEEAKSFGVNEEFRRQFVRFGLSKANYCAPQPDIWLRRDLGGVLVPEVMHKVRKPGKNTTAGADNDEW